MAWLGTNWHRVLAHASGLFTLVWLAFDYFSGGGSFTFNRTAMLRTGSAGLILLVASLSCTPVRRLLNWPRAGQIRRAFGLYAFLYITLHLLTYAVWENGLDLELIARDLEERPAMSAGLAAFAALIPLALTSTRGWQRRLGKRWKRLHRLVYVAAMLSVLHYLWLDRDIITTPVVFAVIISVLLILRLPQLRARMRQA